MYLLVNCIPPIVILKIGYANSYLEPYDHEINSRMLYENKM